MFKDAVKLKLQYLFGNSRLGKFCGVRNWKGNGSMSEIKCFVFDAYGTLFDVHSAVARHSELVGENAARVSEIWRNKQLEYSWTRAGMGKYRDFWQLTEDALDFALAAVPGANPEAKSALLDAYMSLDCYKEVPKVLAGLKESGMRTGILSNGSPHMLQSAVRSAGLDTLIDAQLSVDAIGTFKTVPATYQLVTDHFGVPANQVSFQSSNRWDIAGAVKFGFHTVWINRTGQPDEYHDLPPATVLGDLNGLT